MCLKKNKNKNVSDWEEAQETSSNNSVQPLLRACVPEWVQEALVLDFGCVCVCSLSK